MKKLLIIILCFAMLLSGCQKAPEETPQKPDENIAAENEAKLAKDLFEKAVALKISEDYAAALESINSAIEKESENIEYYLERADIYLYLPESLDKALEDYLKVLEFDKTNADAHLGVGEIYLRRGDFSLAAEYFEETLEVVADERIEEKLEELQEGIYLDSFGRKLRTDHYKDGKLVWYHIYSYDGIMETGAVCYDGAGNETDRIEIPHDEEGRPLAMYGYYVDDGKFTVQEIRYDENGNQLNERYDENGNVIGYSVYEEDEKGRTVRINYYEYVHSEPVLSTVTLIDYYGDTFLQKTHRTFAGDGTCVGIIDWVYNDDGKMIEYYYKNGNDEILFWQKHFYDENGNKTTVITYDAEGKETDRENYTSKGE